MALQPQKATCVFYSPILSRAMMMLRHLSCMRAAAAAAQGGGRRGGRVRDEYARGSATNTYRGACASTKCMRVAIRDSVPARFCVCP